MKSSEPRRVPSRAGSALVSHLLALALVVVAAGGDSLGCGGSSGPSLCGRAGDDCAELGDCCSFACIGGSCQCAPAGVSCNLDEACCSGLFCDDGTCAPGCRGDGHGCTLDSDCCDGGCEGVVPVCGEPRCNEEGARCTENGDCCGSLACREGRCAAICGTSGADCSEDGDCCSGFTCPYAGGTCEPVCSKGGQFCDSAAGPECCAGFECGPAGICVSCAAAGFTCSVDDDCCTGLSCGADGVCTCGGTGETCGADGDCCDNLLCFGTSCRCANFGEKCTEDDDCCSYDEACIEGQCRPTTCRNVGSGCIEPTDCCDGGCSATGDCCLPLDVPCYYSSDCCDSLVCLSDTDTCGACRALGAACGSTSDCCEGQCVGNVCRPTLGGACTDVVTCVSPLECDDDATCCKAHGQSCVDNGDCCDQYGLVCGGTYYTSCCVPQDGACSSTGQCCSGQGMVCADGNCCKDETAICTADAQCCSGTCTGLGVGGATAGTCDCSAPGERCVDEYDCCFVAYETENTCNNGLCCKDVDALCSLDTDCCSGDCRPNGHCN